MDFIGFNLFIVSVKSINNINWYYKNQQFNGENSKRESLRIT